MHPTIADNLYLKWGTIAEPLIQYGTQTFPLWKEALGLPADFDPLHLTEGIL